MSLLLPFDVASAQGGAFLIAGMGGGFDVFCGLPIYFELKQRGYDVYLASLSFADLEDYEDGEWLSPTLVGVTHAAPDLTGYHPERYLARYLGEQSGDNVTVWCFDAQGTAALAADYRLLMARLGIGGIILADGGVDSLTRGDEELCGTILEDYLSLAAVSLLNDVPLRVIACIGMGVEGDVSHGCILENIAALTQRGGLLGTSALLPQSEAYRQYEAALTVVHSQPRQQPSVVNASIVSSARGHFGDYHLTTRTQGSKLWISPLMSLYWFFDVDAVAAQNLFLPQLQAAQSMSDIFAATYEARERITLRPASAIRLT